MPQSPRGQKRPADIIGNAVQITRIATGQFEQTPKPKSAAAEPGGKGGKAGASKMAKADRLVAAMGSLTSRS
jgi:hypothetical protein